MLLWRICKDSSWGTFGALREVWNQPASWGGGKHRVSKNKSRLATRTPAAVNRALRPMEAAAERVFRQRRWERGLQNAAPEPEPEPEPPVRRRSVRVWRRDED